MAGCQTHLVSNTSSFNVGVSNSYLATISSGGSVSLALLNLPGGGQIQPVLQRADGSYVGTALTQLGGIMIGFTASGQQLFSVANDTPQIATADGGVIGASGTTYNQYGNVTGQLASVPTQSWTGNSYQVGSVEQVAWQRRILATRRLPPSQIYGASSESRTRVISLEG